jgi:N-acetyl sugar amidotransferase
MINYCTACLLPDTKPDLQFDENGVCAACSAFSNRAEVDWHKRHYEFNEIINKYKSTSGWDCIVPVSGGKDSTAQVLKVLELGLRPLCVTATTCDLSDIGRDNIENIKSLGVDYLEFSPNPVVRKKLNRIGLRLIGDIAWPEHVGIFTIPVRAAIEHKVPLIIWGENSQNEFGGPAASQDAPFLDRRWLEEFGGLLGLRTTDLIGMEELVARDLIPYTYPTDLELKESKVTGLFLGHYFPWDGMSNYLIAQAHGFKSFGQVIEGSMVDYENLDNHQHGIHDYFKFLKFGFSRATDIASLHIRRGRLSRAEALEIVKTRDGKYPSSYLGKPLAEILSRIEITIEEFNEVCDKFTNRRLFKENENGHLMRDSSGSLIKIKYDN